MDLEKLSSSAALAEKDKEKEDTEAAIKKEKELRKPRNERYLGMGTMSLSDFNKIYDKTIMRGIEHQAFVPRLEEPFKENFNFKIYGYSISKYYYENNDRHLRTDFFKNEEENLLINLPRRSTSEYLEWDPTQFCSEFKVLCFRLIQYIKQTYNLDFSDYELLEYYRICKMNKGIFLSTIHSDQSPFLEFVRAKRAKLAK